MFISKKDCPKLTTRELNILLPRAKAGCKKSISRIVLSFIPFVIYKIKKDFAQYNIQDEMELYNAGVIALLKTIEKFDPDKGFTFLTYATWWIFSEVRKSILLSKFQIKLPRTLLEKYLFDRKEFLKDIKKYDYKREYANLILLTSLQVPIEGDESMSIQDTIKSDYNIEEEHIKTIKRQMILNAINTLKPDFAKTIKMRFGFEPYYETKTLQDIADHFKITKEAVRLRINKSLKLLKDMLYYNDMFNET